MCVCECVRVRVYITTHVEVSDYLFLFAENQVSGLTVVVNHTVPCGGGMSGRGLQVLTCEGRRGRLGSGALQAMGSPESSGMAARLGRGHACHILIPFQHPSPFPWGLRRLPRVEAYVGDRAE